MIRDDETIAEFVAESRENFLRVESAIVAIERSPARVELLGDILRAVHTLKGTSSFLGFVKLEALAHAAETLLARLRDMGLAIDDAVGSALLEMVDAVRRALDLVVATGAEGDADHAELIAQISALAGERANADARPIVDRAETAPGAARNDPSAHASESALRVDVAVLDRLVNLSGELVLAHNQLLHATSRWSDATLAAASQRLSAVASALHEAAMETRMQPLGPFFAMLPRVVRDLARSSGKKIDLDVEGGDTELDRSLLDAIRDPIVHLLRNAVDHGIETPDERARAKKSAVARLVLSASHERGHVRISLRDDGRGVDLASLRAKAVERGILSARAAAEMSDARARELVFVPGLSTAENVTSLSGRGVGMDIVKANVERVGGTIAIDSVPSRGTTFTLTVPLTLAILPAVSVLARGGRFAIPQAHLLEIAKIERSELASRIEDIHGAPVTRLRGRLLPVVDLADALDLDATSSTASSDDGVYLAVLQAGARAWGAIVDDVGDVGDVVIKPMPVYLQGLHAFSGATILRDGSVVLVLDVVAIARRAGVHGDTPSSSSSADAVAEAPANAPAAAGEMLLLLRSRDGGSMAMPVDVVRSVAELSVGAIERSGGDEVVQHGGEILRLVRLSNVLQERRRTPRAASPSADERETIQVAIVDDRAGRVAIAVDQLEDIAREPISARRAATRAGVSYSAVIRGRVTEILDVSAILDASSRRSIAPEASR